MTNEHPILVPNGGTVAVHWLQAVDGRCHGKEFYEATPACKAALLAQAKQVAIKGRVSKVPENGHELQGEFSGIQELKPGDYRFMGFRHQNVFYLTNGAVKQSKVRRQEPDYRFAKRLKDEFLAALEQQR